MAWAEAASTCRWSASRVAWAAATADVPGSVAPEGAGSVTAGVDVSAAVVADVPVWLVSSEVSLAWAVAMVDWAEVMSFCSGVGSRVATVWPAATVWPTVTGTVATVPDVPKSSSDWFTGATVPTELTVATAVPVLTVAVR